MSFENDDEPETPQQEAERLEFRRIRGLPPVEFVAHLEDLLSVGREAMALTHLYDQFFEHLDQSNRNMPRLKEIVTLILAKGMSHTFIGHMAWFLRTPGRNAEPKELLDLITAWGNRKLHDAIMTPHKLYTNEDVEKPT